MTVEKEIIQKIEDYFDELARESQKKELLLRINQALEENDEATFAQLSSELKALS